MKPEIQPGRILIAQGALIPASIQREDKVYVQGWQLANHLNRGELIRTIRLAEWKLFSQDATVEMQVFGFDDNKAIHKAIRRIVATIRAKSFNCLEIKQVEMRRCLGFPYVLVSAHSWHIQASAAMAANAL